MSSKTASQDQAQTQTSAQKQEHPTKTLPSQDLNVHPKDGTGTRNVVPEVQSQSQEGAERELLFNKPQGGGCQPRPVARQGAFGEVSRRFSSSLLGRGGGGRY